MISSACLVFIISDCFADPFFSKHQEGWHWYQDPEEEQKQKTQTKSAPQNPTEEMQALRKRVEDSINLAILYPTEENLKNYARNYYEVIGKGQYFTDAYKLMLMRNPEFDYSLKFPVNFLSQNVYKQEREQSIEQNVREFAKTHGFFFFFKGRCQYCHIFAPTVKAFSKKYGVSVIAVSEDGGKLSEFPDAVQGNYASTRFQVMVYPSLFAVNPKTQQVVPIARGAINLYELEENVARFVEAERNIK